MKWGNIVSVIVWALSGVIMVVAVTGIRTRSADSSSSDPIVVDDRGVTAPLNTVLPAGEVGMIAMSSSSNESGIPQRAQATYNIGDADGIDDNDADEDGDQLTIADPLAARQGSSSAKVKPSSQKTKKKAQSSSEKPAKKSSAKKVSAEQAPCVDINTADEAALVTLKGIGPALAAKILEHRAEHGAFSVKEDLLKVKGIGPAKFSVIADRVCL